MSVDLVLLLSSDSFNDVALSRPCVGFTQTRLLECSSLSTHKSSLRLFVFQSYHNKLIYIKQATISTHSQFSPQFLKKSYFFSSVNAFISPSLHFQKQFYMYKKQYITISNGKLRRGGKSLLRLSCIKRRNNAFQKGVILLFFISKRRNNAFSLLCLFRVIAPFRKAL